MKNNRRQKNASLSFTLVELLVMSSVFAVLLSLLQPALIRILEKARQMSCANNLANVAKAFQVYSDDYNGFAPDKFYKTTFGWLGTAGSYGAYKNIGADKRGLNVYLGGAPYQARDPVPAAHCPSDDIAYDKYGSTYGVNNHTGYHSLSYSNGNGIPLSLVAHPQKMLLMGANAGFNFIWTENMTPFLGYHRDLSTWNFSFVDGHVDDLFISKAGLKKDSNYTIYYDQ